MQKATAQAPQQRQPFAGLFIGPPGAAKTSFAIQFPSPYIADIDLNMDGPIRRLKKANPNFEYFYDMIPFKDGKPVAVEDQWERLISCCDAAMKEAEVKTIIVDGLTHVNNILIAHVCKKAGKKEMDISLWIPFRTELQKFIMKLRGCGKSLIMICHEENQYSANPNNIMQQTLIKRSPAVSSKLTDYFGAFFTDVWRFESRPGPGMKPTFWVQLTKTAYDDLKNSYGEAGEVEVTDGKKVPALINLAIN